MNALCKALDDKWTVYVQPHLNGLQPDIVIFCEDAGIGVFEVKDWDLGVHRIIKHENGEYDWQVRAYDTGKWTTRHKEDSCPLKQVEKYCQSIFKYEIPILDAKRLLDQKVHSLIQPFVYFHKHTTDDVKNRLQCITDKYSNVFGCDNLEPSKLRAMLAKRYLKHGSKFTGLMQEIGLAERLPNALAYPKHGDTNIQSLLKPLNRKQQQLLPNEPGYRRFKGAAGSGKTFVLVHKAVNAAREGKKVLLVCFNITMANYLRDLITCLARHYDRNCLRNIEIGHFHRCFPLETTETDKRNMKGKVDVLLIDEGQDFKREWIETLQTICASGYHLMFCEDRRQNIYCTQSIPIRGRPNELNESYRIPPQTAKLANFLFTWAKQEGESETVTSNTSIELSTRNLFVRNIWFNGMKSEAISTLKDDIKNLVQDRNVARPDIAILVCTIADGWEVCQVLDELHLPKPQCNFESREEHIQLRQLYQQNRDDFQKKLDELRRGYKAGFWMQGGRIKVCTIHSFKGWELSNILVFFNPEKGQEEAKVPLLYTAITRSQQNLTIYNTD